MLLAEAALGNARWLVQLVGIGVAGLVVYLPVLIRFGLTEGERIALRTGIEKIRGRTAAA